MKQAVRQTRTRLRELFRQHGFHPRTDFGQNFLIDLNLVEYIVNQAELTDRDVVLEVGAGTGGLTTYLAEGAAAVVSVEVDAGMHRIAQSVVEPYENVTLLRVDALKNKNNFSPVLLEAVRRELAVSPQRRLKLVSNLPYNIATPVVSNLVANDFDWERMVVTIQLELAEKMIAQPAGGNYGALSVWLQSQCDLQILKRLPPDVFWPQPKVHSAIMRLRPDRERRERIRDRRFFQDFLRRLFHQRRKYARSVLVGMYRKQLSKPEVDEAFASLGLDETMRAEQMDVETLVELSNRLKGLVEAREDASGLIGD